MASGNLTPRRPEKGYALRWLRLSCDLALRRPLELIFAGLLGCFVLGLFSALTLSQLLKTGMAVPIASAVFSVTSGMAAQFLLMHILAQFLMADETMPSDRPPFLRSASGAISGMMMFFMFIFLFEAIGVAGAAAPDNPDLRPSLYSGLPEEFRILMTLLDIGAFNLAIGIYPIAFYGFFAWPLILVLGVEGNGARLAGHLLIMRMPIEFFSILGVAMIVLAMLATLPFFIVLPLAILFTGWIYVGAREIFTGHKENARQVSAAMAGSRA